MSQIKLKHSGGNSVIIAAPSSNPASDRTLTLDGSADGTILSSASTLDATKLSGALPAIDGSNLTGVGGGKILQTQSAWNHNSAYTTGSDVTVVEQAITPSAATSRIVIIFRFEVSVTGDTYGGYNIFRGSTVVGKSGHQYGGGNSSQYFGAFNCRDQDAPWENEVCVGNYMDHPNTTSATTYYIKMRKDFGGNVRSNRPNNSHDQAYSWNTVATLTLMEVDYS
tara:strand:- start:664 stop:1335 length:672 start_codon:yes stop_codon:yes gene_type:complete